ncbi:hypothetical protein GCM10011371_06880 [Novosphingobium marinum]|nr:hypothetical protein GCM10011371_06880 [Novosphingobium marinum]
MAREIDKQHFFTLAGIAQAHPAWEARLRIGEEAAGAMVQQLVVAHREVRSEFGVP